MKVYFVGAGPGDPGLLTVKAKSLIENCNCCIYAGSLVSPEVIGLIPYGAMAYDSSKMTLEEIIELFKDAKDAGMDVIRLQTGDPSIYGAILEQMNALDGLGVDYEVVPGVSSFQAAAAALKTELTVPEKSQTVILTRIAGRTPVPKEQDLGELAKSGATLCIFLSVQEMAGVVEKLVPHYGGGCPAAVVYRASWPDEKVLKGTLADIAQKTAQNGIKKTAIIIVGKALAKDGAASKLYDKNFSHGYRKAIERREVRKEEKK